MPKIEMLSKRSLNIPSFLVMEVMEKAAEMERQGKNVIHLEVGEPDFSTPQCIKEAAIRAIKEDKTKYTSSLGIIELREAISEHYHQKYRVEVSPEQIIITMGTSPGMFLVFSALLNPGEEVILPNPYYSCYPHIISFMGAIPVPVTVREEEGFQYQPRDIAAHLNEKTKAIIINSPSNPTGSILSFQKMEGISRFRPLIVSDEIYQGLVYEEEEHTILEVTDRALVIGGFSKLYAMTGWRLGYLIVPREFVRPIQKMQQNFFISGNSFVQWAGIAALKEAGPEVSKMKKIYNQRRKLTIEQLLKLGFSISVKPQGAFYVLANAKKFTDNSLNFAFDILKKTGVGIAPGIDFGSNAEGYLRFSYTNSQENIEEGMDRLKQYLMGKTSA